MYTDLLVSIILKNYRINNSFFEEKSPNFFVFIKKFLQIFVQNHKKTARNATKYAGDLEFRGLRKPQQKDEERTDSATYNNMYTAGKTKNKKTTKRRKNNLTRRWRRGIISKLSQEVWKVREAAAVYLVN